MYAIRSYYGFSRNSGRESRAIPRMTGSAPASRTAEAREKELLFTTVPGWIVSPGSTSSSPVARIATLGFRKTGT